MQHPWLRKSTSGAQSTMWAVACCLAYSAGPTSQSPCCVLKVRVIIAAPDMPRAMCQLVALAGGILPVVFLSELAGGLNAACAGVMRGVGRQSLASFINAATYWGIGLPVCVCAPHCHGSPCPCILFVWTWVCSLACRGAWLLLLPAALSWLLCITSLSAGV